MILKSFLSFPRCTSEEVVEPGPVHLEISSSPCSSKNAENSLLLNEVIGNLPDLLPECQEPVIVSAEMLGESIISVDIIENLEEIIILPSASTSTNLQNLVDDEESIPDGSNKNQAAKTERSLISSSSPSSTVVVNADDDDDEEVTFSKKVNKSKRETDQKIPAFLTSHHQQPQIRSSDRSCSIPVVNCSTPVVSLMQLGRRTVESTDPLKCSDCDFTTRSAPTMIRHTIEEHGIRTFSCTQCEFSAASAISIMEHNYTEHKVQSQPKLVTCSKCSYAAPETVDIASHFQQKHMTTEN